MRKLFTTTLFIILVAAPGLAQGGSAASPTLKVSDGTRSFNGVNELRVPVGCVTFSGRTAIINCTGGGSSGTTNSQNGNLFFASPDGSYGLPSWRAIFEADLPSLNASKIGAGIFATARLGSGTASSATYLRGDGAWATFPADAVTSVFGRSGAVIAATNDYTWAQIDKSTSSLADLTTRSAGDLSSGTLATARLGTGTASGTTYLRGDQTWATPVTSITGTGNQVTASAATGAVTLSLPQSIASTSTPQFARLGLGVAADATAPLVVSTKGKFSSVGNLSVNSTDADNEDGIGVGSAGGQIRLLGNFQTGIGHTAALKLLPDTTGIGRWWLAGIGTDFVQAARQGNFEFYDINALAPRFIIDSSGRMGIGTGYTQPFSNSLTVGAGDTATLSLGGGVTWSRGLGAPAGACSTGSFYSRTAGGVGIPAFYACENSAWVAK